MRPGELVKTSLAVHSSATPAQAGAHGPTALSKRSLGKALQLLEKRGVAEVWVPAFAGMTVRFGVRDDSIGKPSAAASGHPSGEGKKERDARILRRCVRRRAKRANGHRIETLIGRAGSGVGTITALPGDIMSGSSLARK
jgi:hypothetical protein